MNAGEVVFKINGDGSGLDKSIDAADKKINTLSNNIRSIDKSISAAKSAGLDALQLLADKQGFLTEQIAETEKKYNLLSQAQEQVSEAWKNGAVNDEDYVKFNTELSNTAALLERLTSQLTETEQQLRYQDSVLADLSLDMHEYDSALAPLENELKQINSAIKDTGGSTELYAQKSGLLTEEISVLKNKLEALEQSQEKVNAALESGDITAEQYREWQREIETTKGKLESLTGEQERLTGEIGASSDNALTFGGVLKANIISELITKGIETLTDVFRKLADALKDVVTETASYGDTVDKQSQRLGMSTQAYQEWNYILSQNGADISVLQTGMRTLTNTIDNAKSGTESAAAAFEKLGLSAENLYSMSGEEQFSAVIEALQDVENETERNALANDLLGRSYQTLIPLLNQSSDTISTLRQKAHDTNQILDEDGVAASVAYTDALDTLTKSFEGLRNELGAQVLPVITELLDALTEAISATNKKDIEQLLEKLARAFEELAEVIMNFVEDGGIEKIIDVFDWFITNGDLVVDVLIALGGAWAADKAVSFGKAVGELPELITKAAKGIKELSDTAGSAGTVIKNFGTEFSTAMETTAASVTTAEGAITVSFGAIAAAAAAAAAAIAAAAVTAHELNTISDALVTVSNAEQESADRVAAIQDRWTDIDAKNGLEKYEALQEMQTDLIAQKEEWAQTYLAVNSEIQTLEDKRYRSTAEAARLTVLQKIRDSLDTEFATIEHYQVVTDNALKKYTSTQVGYLEQQAAAQEQAQQNIANTTESVVAEYWDSLRAATEEKMSEYDSALKKHQMTEDEYWAARKEYLEAHRDEESEDWWEYYDDVADYYDKLAETEAKAAEKAAEAAAKAEEEAAKELESSIKTTLSDTFRDLETEQLENGYSSEWLYEQERAFIETLDHNSDIYKEYNLKLLKTQKSTNESAEKELEDSAAAQIETLKDLYTGVTQARDSLAESISFSPNDLFKSESASDARTGASDTTNLIDISGLEKQLEAKRQLPEKIAELLDEGVSDSIINRLLQLDPADALDYANQMLNTPSLMSRINSVFSEDEDLSARLADMVTEASEDWEALGTEAGKTFGESFMESLGDEWEAGFEKIFGDEAYAAGLIERTETANSMVGAGSAVINTAAYAADMHETDSRYSQQTEAVIKTGELALRLVDADGSYIARLVNAENASLAVQGGK